MDGEFQARLRNGSCHCVMIDILCDTDQRGLYGGSNLGSNAVIATNTTNANQVQLTNEADIKGSVYVGIGGDPAVVIQDDSSGGISGSITSLTESLQLPVLTEPTGLGASIGNVIYEAGTQTLSSNLHVDSWEVNNFATVQVSGDIIVLCEDDFRIENFATIDLMSGATLTVYVKGQLPNDVDDVVIANSAQVNTASADPNRMTINYLGTSGVKVTNSARAYVTLVAPNAHVLLEDQAKLYGGIVADSIGLQGNAELHIDVKSTSYAVRWIDQP